MFVSTVFCSAVKLCLNFTPSPRPCHVVLTAYSLSLLSQVSTLALGCLINLLNSWKLCFSL